ncbi:MAG: hypothetical protein WC220_12360 [Pedobacter sp.]|jgi:hypothetical protein
MNNNKSSYGIARAHNGAIGESRTKSFLIDRFWILERSVDIEGADIIIQRRLQGQGILDDVPPRFGIVQSKFSQDENTPHLLKQEYVIDEKGKPHQEFFLILNVGFEDSQKMCLMSAKDIVENFNVDTDGYFRLSTKKIISKFPIVNKGSSLDFIDNSIQCAEFYKNRLYIFKELKSPKPNFNSIYPDFKRNIDYVDGNIPDLFKEQKLRAYDFIVEIEKMHSLLLKFIQEVDPVEACYIAESFNHYHQDRIETPQIFNKDFYYKCKRYFDQINLLKGDGVLETYLSLKKIVKDEVDNFLSSNIRNVDVNSQLIVYLKYSSKDLSNLIIQNEIKPLNDITPKDYFSYSVLTEGEIKMLVNIGLNVRNSDLSTCFNECCLIDVMEKIYELRYFDINNKAK